MADGLFREQIKHQERHTALVIERGSIIMISRHRPLAAILKVLPKHLLSLKEKKPPVIQRAAIAIWSISNLSRMF